MKGLPMRIKSYHMERIEITGPMNEWDDAFTFCGKEGFYIIRSGAEPIGIGRIDSTRFFIIAERAALDDPIIEEKKS